MNNHANLKPWSKATAGGTRKRVGLRKRPPNTEGEERNGMSVSVNVACDKFLKDRGLV